MAGARRRGRTGARSAENGRIVLMIVGVGLGAFAIGFALTAVSFLRARAPAEVVTVPDVREMEVPEAERTLERNDLELVVGDSFPNPGVAAGAILAQSPLPGQEVGLGAEVRVMVSTGPQRAQVPPVDAMTLDLATRALQTAGFNVLVEEVEGEGEPGRAIGTDPPAGSPVALPATVRLLVGTGAYATEMPVLIGMLEADALGLAEEQGLYVQEVVYERSPFGEPGSVVGQEPAPGDSIGPETPVRLRVTGPPPAADNDPPDAAGEGQPVSPDNRPRGRDE